MFKDIKVCKWYARTTRISGIHWIPRIPRFQGYTGFNDSKINGLSGDTVDWWNSYESSYSSYIGGVPENKTFRMDYVGPYVINIELAANKAEEAKKINLDYLVIEQVVVKNGNNYELARDLLIEIGDDPNDYLFDNYFDMSTGGIFDGCGNSITINQSYGMVNGVEVNPATLSNTRCVGQSPLFLIHSQHYSSSTSITNTIQNLGWYWNSSSWSYLSKRQ